MWRLLRFFGSATPALACILVVMLVLGSRVPRQHMATAAITLNAPQQGVWDRISNVSAQPGWRSGLKAVDPLPMQDSHPCWLEHNSMGKMPMCEVLSAPTATRIVRIADPSLPFGGTWTYTLSPDGPATTRLNITENGTTGPPLWRFIEHYLYHEDTQMKQYEADLAKSFTH